MLTSKRRWDGADFGRVRWSVYAAEQDDLAKLIEAVFAIKSLGALPWFGASVKSFRAFRMEQGADLTTIVKPTS